MEPQENSNVMQSSVPVNLEPKVEPVVPEKPVVEKTGKKPSKMNGMIIGMIVLVVCLVVGLTYYVLKDNGTDLLALDKQTDTTTGSETEDSSTTDSTTEEDSTESTTCEDTGTTSCEVNVDNKGWSLFSVPEYNLSVEVPTYSTAQEMDGEGYQNVWKTWFDPSPVYLSDGKYTTQNWLENLIGTMYVNFYPQIIPSKAGCDMNCLGEHYISVNIFSNSTNQNLDTVIANYRSGWEKGNVAEDVPSTNLQGDVVSKWGMNVWNFEASTPGGTTRGYVLIKGAYIYEVRYSLASNPSESYQIALKVIDSMKFGE